MKKLARAMLQTVIQHLPENRREYAKAMLSELEETNGWTALEWASGGIQLWLHAQRGEIMKMAACG